MNSTFVDIRIVEMQLAIEELHVLLKMSLCKQISLFGGTILSNM